MNQQVAVTKVPKWTGDQYETDMEGLSMATPPQDIVNVIGIRGLNGWTLSAVMPVDKPIPEGSPEGTEAETVWGLIFQRKKSEILVARG